MTIGSRAVQAIQERAADTDVKPEALLEDLGASKDCLREWGQRGRTPGGYLLCQMALAGYDTYWILTGRRYYPAVAFDMDIAEHEEET
jgi:hypothetical protein